MFSWERPIEQVILEYCDYMANQFDEVSIHNKETGWFATNKSSKDAGLMAKAYRTVGNQVRREIKLREKVKDV